MTWYPTDFLRVPLTYMKIRSELATGYPARTCKFYDGVKVFEFGYGLGYSNFSYEFVHVTFKKLYLNQLLPAQTLKFTGPHRYLSISELNYEHCDSIEFSAKVAVKNLGEMSSKHPVLLFVRQAKLSYGSPQKQLIGFQSITLGAGERAEVDFVLKPCEHLSKANRDGFMVIEEGSYYLIVGDKEHHITVEL